MDTETKVALIVRLEEIKRHIKEDFFRSYAVEEIETLIEEIRAENIVPF